jgi:hypothetical protein
MPSSNLAKGATAQYAVAEVIETKASTNLGIFIFSFTFSLELLDSNVLYDTKNCAIKQTRFGRIKSVVHCA